MSKEIEQVLVCSRTPKLEDEEWGTKPGRDTRTLMVREGSADVSRKGSQVKP